MLPPSSLKDNKSNRGRSKPGHNDYSISDDNEPTLNEISAVNLQPVGPTMLSSSQKSKSNKALA